ncbi:protein SRC2-like [Magnolia sinica]|uniref:protein SRC2-like n=1 Tax=Magnolia sinica TaxID=86752 RepID=UPI002659BC4F|nr:protein SRC2-like [Magnolia sinica]
MASARAPPPKPLDLEITIVSAKHLKNVNWRNGELKPYTVFWIDPDRKLATKPDDSGSTRPVWNERFTLAINLPLHESFLTFEIFHSKPSETPKPLVGSVRYPIKDLIDSDETNKLITLELRRPSGRPHGKIRVKLAVRERPVPPTPDYHIAPSYYYSSAPPPPPARDYRGGFSPSSYGNPLPPPPVPPLQSQYPYGNYADPYSGYYPGYYSPSPPLPPRPFFDRVPGYGSGPSGPSAPVDFSSSAPSGASLYEQKPKGGKMGFGTGLAVGAVAGALGGLALEEGLKYEEGKIAERVESDLAGRDDFSDYHGDY